MDKSFKNINKSIKKRSHDLVQIADLDPDIIEISFVQSNNVPSDKVLKLSTDSPSSKKFKNGSSQDRILTSGSKTTKYIRHSLPASSQNPTSPKMPLKITNNRSSAQTKMRTALEQTLQGSSKSDHLPKDSSSLKDVLCKDKDSDVYSSLLDNYRYLVTPKSWSVTEFVDEMKDRFIIFFNADIIHEKNFLIPVMKKSITICKETKINYSIHGLPVDTAGTILPKILDNTKKLLSILHIFDKMQVCQGLGDDLDLKQSDVIYKDSCRSWRHRNCKIILIKATRCPTCSETRDFLLSKHNLIMKCK